jgi:hypothetical protein
MSNVIEIIDKDLQIGLLDIEKAANTAGIDVVKGIKFLEIIFGNIGQDITVAENIVSIINPTLAKELVASEQVIGTIDAIITMLSEAFSQPLTIENISAISSNIDKISTVWEAQKSVIQTVYTQIAKDITVITQTRI